MSTEPVRITRARDGRFRVRLPPEERDLLRSFAAQLQEAITARTDPALSRLWPDAYPENPELGAEWRRLVGDELSRAHRDALETLRTTAGADHLTEDELLGWVRAVNQVRLLLGTRLELTEDRPDQPFPLDDPRAATLEVYDYLSWLQEQLVDALASDR